MLQKTPAFSKIKTAFAVLALAAAGTATGAPDATELHVVLPLTGSASFVGKASQKGIQAEEKVINEDGGINGSPVKFIFHDDQSSPRVAVQLVNQLSKEPVIIGSEIAGICNAMAPLLNKGPFTYCLSPGVTPKPGSNMFSVLMPLTNIAPTVLKYFRSQGWTRIALLVSTDASGQDALHGYDEAFKLPENSGMQLVKTLHFNPGALNVSAQMTEISEAKPQAMIGWATGAPAGTILKGYAQAGLDIPIVIGHGNVAPEFMKQYASVVPKQLYFPAGIGAIRADNITLDPRLAKTRAAYLNELDKAGLVPENAIEVVWDPIMLTVDALRHVGPNPTAQKVHDYLDKIKGYAGISGIYDFTAVPNRGLTGKANAMAQWDAKKGEFVAITEAGGDPIKAK